MPVVYNRADTGKSKEELKNKNKKPASKPKSGGGSGGGPLADLLADKPKAIGIGVGSLVLILFLVWFLFMRGGGENAQDPSKIVNNTGPNSGKPVAGADAGTPGKKGGAVGTDDDLGMGGGGLKNRGSLGSGDEGIK